jgi:hypothetical protein
MGSERTYIAAGIAATILFSAVHFYLSGILYSRGLGAAVLFGLALFSTAAAGRTYLLLRSAGDGRAPRFLWLAVALGLWALAELTWGIYEVVLQSGDLPVSLADVFWLAGYVPLVYSFYLAFMSITFIRPAVALTFISFLFFAALAFFSLGDAVVNSVDLTENAVNVAYVGADLVVLTLAISLAAAFFSASRGSSWLFSALALAMSGVGDLLFFQMAAADAPDPYTATRLFFILQYVWIGIAALLFPLEK